MNATSSLAVSLLILSSMGNTATAQIIKDDNIPFVLKTGTSSNYTLTNEYKKLYQKLYTYRNLNNNWDGYDGVRPPEEVITTTEKFISILEKNLIPPPVSMVSGSGQVALFWKNKSEYIEVDFDENNYLSYFCKLNNKVYGEDGVIVSSHISEKLLSSLNFLHEKNTTTQAKNKSVIYNKRSTIETDFLTFVS